MVQLARNAAKLLSTVKGRAHATDDDHEGPPAKRRRVPVAQETRKVEDIYAEPASSDSELRNPIPRTRKDEDIYAEPASTDEELHIPSPRRPRPSKATSIAAKAPGLQEADELKVPTKRASRNGLNGSTKKVARSGGKAAVDHNKENSSSAVPGSSSKSDQDFDFGIEHLSQRSNKSSKAKTFTSKAKTFKNIHAAVPEAPVSKAPVPKKPTRKNIRVPDANKNKEKKDRTRDDKASVDSDSEVSMIGVDELIQSDPELRNVGVKKPSKKNTVTSKSDMMDIAELDRILDSTPEDKDLTPLTKRALTKSLNNTPEDKDLTRATRRSRPTALHVQLGDWIKDRGPGSSQPDSSVPSEDMDNLKEYLEKLPEEEVEGSCCPLCRAPVNDDDYWDYWKGKEKTVKNQNRFCHAHRIKSAWDEYRSEGYPDIIWTDVPQRIRKHRMTLFKILNNERSSGYRARYEPIALTGNAAAVPTKRKDLPEHVQQELESYALDHQSVYPGYYGPHGRRVITENVMKLLKNEIKNCTDAVVQGSGPATFVQAVLVPEMAVLLIMEDCRVDREEAEEIREKTYELGMLLNEEIEDRVELYDQSDDENEYGQR